MIINILITVMLLFHQAYKSPYQAEAEQKEKYYDKYEYNVVHNFEIAGIDYFLPAIHIINYAIISMLGWIHQ